MQNENSILKIYRNSELRYKNRHLVFNKNTLHQRIDDLYKQAKKKYFELPNPKTCSLDTYISIWINEVIGYDITQKSVGKPFKMDNPPKEYKANVDFLNNFPQDLIKEIKTKYSNTLDKIDYSLIREKWLAIVVEKNNFSLNKGYRSRLEMHLNHFMIPKSEYDKFLKNVDKVIKFYNQRIVLDPSKFSEWESSRTCFICDIKLFPFKKTEELTDIFKKEHPILKKYQSKIKIRLDSKSNTKYIKESDFFDITLDEKVNLNHQVMDLIHELAHVVSMLKIFKKDKHLAFMGTYYWEKLAIQIEMNFLNKYFPKLFLAKLGNILQIIHQTLFEIEIYHDPKKDPDKLYAICFNRCFKGASQKNNRSYLLNQDILYHHFRLLPYAVAYTNTLKKFCTSS